MLPLRSLAPRLAKPRRDDGHGTPARPAWAPPSRALSRVTQRLPVAETATWPGFPARWLPALSPVMSQLQDSVIVDDLAADDS
jgi:hypothetical protein